MTGWEVEACLKFRWSREGEVVLQNVSLVFTGHSLFLKPELMLRSVVCRLFDVDTHGFFPRFFFLLPQLFLPLYYVYSHLKKIIGIELNSLGIVLKLLYYLLKDMNFKNFIKSGWESWHYIDKMRKTFLFLKLLFPKSLNTSIQSRMTFCIICFPY